MITCDSLQRKLQGQYITLARPQSVGNQQNSVVHYSLSSFSPDFHWGQRQSFSLFSVHLWKRWELLLSRVVIGLPARSELTSAPLSTIPLSRVQLQSNDGDGAQYQLYSLEWWWQWWRWWCDYIDDGDEMMMIFHKYKIARGQQSCVSTLIQRPSLSQDYPGPALHQDLPEDLPFQQSAFVQDCSGFKEDLQSQKCTNICSGFYGHAWGNHQITACLTV